MKHQIAVLTCLLGLIPAACASRPGARHANAPSSEHPDTEGHREGPHEGDRHAAGHHGRHHPFPAEHYAPIFEDASRAEWQRPDQVIAALHVAEGARVADVGAGSGYFAFRLATAVGEEGVVYGVDIEASMVRYMEERAEREGAHNVRPITATPTSPQLPEPVDVIFMCNTWHHVGEQDERRAYAAMLRRNLRPGGRIILVEWRAGMDIPVHSPPDAMRIPRVDLVAELESAGMTLTEDLDGLLPYQDVLVFSVQ